MFPRRAGRAIAVALVASLISANAIAQVPNFTLGPNTVVGRSAIGTGPAQAIPFASLIATMLAGPVSIPTVNTNSIVFKGSISGQATVQAQATAGTPTILLPNTSGTLADSAVFPLALSSTTGAMSCPTCSSQFVASRSAATALDLHAATIIQTGGYATAGDGGGATFKNVGTAPFIDSFANPCTVVGGSSYTNGGYFGVLMSGGTGRGIYAFIAVSGGAVTSVNYVNSPGNAYTAGDVLTVSNSSIGGTGSGFSCTIPSVTAPRGSFVDAAGTHWQIIPDSNGTNSVLQFGAVADWTGVDASATDNFNAFQAASWYGTYYFSISLFSNGPLGHAKIMLPAGEYMVCGTHTQSLIIGNSVIFEGVGSNATFIRMCDAFGTTTNFIELCDPTWHSACMGTWLRFMQLSSNRNLSITPAVWMVHSNNVQDWGGLYNMKVGAGARGGILFEKGFGGSSYGPDLDHVEVGANSSGAMVQLGNTVASGLNYGTTITNIRSLNLGGPGSAPFHAGPGLTILGGFVNLEGLHCEQIPTCVAINIPTGANGGMVHLHNVNAAGNPVTCTEVISLSATNVPGNTFVGMVPAGGCTHVVTNGQSGGTNVTTSIGLDMQFNP